MSLSLTWKRILAFAAYTLLSYILAIVFFLVPLSVLAWHDMDSAGAGGAGFFVGFLIIVAPFVAIPGALIAGFAALPIINHALKATIRSRSDYLAFPIAMVVCALIAIVITYAVTGVGALILRNSDIPNV